jgi:hypothetical protein
MHVGNIGSLNKPSAPTGRMIVQNFAGHRVHQSGGHGLARENQSMNVFIIDRGELYVLPERRFDD